MAYHIYQSNRNRFEFRFLFFFLSMIISIFILQEFCGSIKNRMPIVRCYPTPDAFNPCEDVMGKNYLRFVVWLVAFAAVSGNVAVIVVLMR